MPDGCISRFDRKRQSGYKAMIVFIDLTALTLTTTIKSGKDTLGRLPDCFFKNSNLPSWCAWVLPQYNERILE